MPDKTKAELARENAELWDHIESMHAELGDLLGVDDDESDEDDDEQDEED